MQQIRAIFFGLLLTLGTVQLSNAAAPALNKTEEGVALHGYDAVAYFSGKAVKGDEKLSVSYQGVKYLFANDADKTTFAKEPAKYAPQFGGFCAYGASQGYEVDIDPTLFHIVDGKLYLNVSKQADQNFLQDVKGTISKATVNYAKGLEK